MHRMTYIFVLWMGLMGACKSDVPNADNPVNDTTTFEDSTIVNVVKDSTEVVTTPVDRPKSVPKEEPKEQTGSVTSVPVTKAGDQPKSVPKPQDTLTKGTIENVPVTDRPKSVPKEEPKAVEDKVKEVPVESPMVDHSSWNTLLSKYVSPSGKVNYKGFKSDLAALNSYIQQLESISVKGLSRNEQLAFWINAYNAYTIKKIVDNYPVSSITKLDGGKPWDVKWIKLDGRTLSLNNIENDIIRPKFNEPRIHFAVNCAAKSCPPLLNKAWTSSNLEKYFEIQTKAFINSSRYNSISSTKVEVSKIFEWYASDFGDLITYLNKYSSSKINTNATIIYKEYDWALNE